DVVAIVISVEGRVQEAGFVATVRALASEHHVEQETALSPEGKVRVVVRGERRGVVAFRDALKKSTADTARSFSALWTSPEAK
ncbi:MAG: acylphosphatase, partial [Planctomycetota bacterium]|nr:acylphosphatase [Planctomycetota bacterium]